MWDAFREGKPYRVPVRVSGSISNLLCNPAINKTGCDFRDFFTSPAAQIECQLRYQEWTRNNIVCDSPMGPPEDGWRLSVDFQNSWEAGWFGCPLRFFGSGVPDTVEILKEEKLKLYDMGSPDPLRGNLLGRAMEFFEYMHDKCPRMEFRGAAVRPPLTIPGEGTDGPLSVAYKLRGAAEVCLDMYEDPGYYHDLMGYVTRNIVRRIKAVRGWRRERTPGWSFADDAAVLLSARDYEEFLYPYHRMLVDEFSGGGPVRVHMCGGAGHLFKFLYDKLNVREFNTGFPLDLGALRRELGPGALIEGGPTVMLLKDGSPGAVRDEVKRICESGIMEGGMFVLIAANNMAPRTPVGNILAMYEAARTFGVYRRRGMTQ